MNVIQTYWLPTLISAVIAYLLGSISFAIPVTKMFIGKDIRTMGSGNAGFTNVLRCVGKPAAAITFVGDFAKGIGAIFLGEMIFHLMCPGVANIDETAKVGAAVAGLSTLVTSTARTLSFSRNARCTSVSSHGLAPLSLKVLPS